MPRTPTDPFFRQLYTRLFEEINNRTEALLDNGSTVRGNEGLLIDPINTAIKYEKDIAVIKTLEDIINLGFQIDREMFGVKHTEDGDN